MMLAMRDAGRCPKQLKDRQSPITEITCNAFGTPPPFWMKQAATRWIEQRMPVDKRSISQAGRFGQCRHHVCHFNGELSVAIRGPRKLARKATCPPLFADACFRQNNLCKQMGYANPMGQGQAMYVVQQRFLIWRT
jgi:hypothetical protein